MNIDLDEKLKQYQRNYYASKKIENKKINYLYSIKTSEKTLRFGNVIVN